jgi:ketol-acid reductoisomerase
LRDIQTGVFARDWIAENRDGKPRYETLLAADLAHPIEKVGAQLRRHMAWLQTQPTTKAA